MDITFNCPKCDQELVVDDSYAGEQIECPECSSQIIVPSESNVSAVKALSRLKVLLRQTVPRLLPPAV